MAGYENEWHRGTQWSSFTSVEAKSDSESSRYRLEEADSPLEYDRIPRRRVRQSCPVRFSHWEELTSQKRARVGSQCGSIFSSCGVEWPNFSSIPDLVKYLRTQSLVSVASLNVQRYKARWLQHLLPLSPMEGASFVERGRLHKIVPWSDPRFVSTF